MKKILLAVLCVGICGYAQAHQPESIEAEYEAKAKVLKIKVNHTTQNRREHFIRRVVVSVNDQQASSKNFFFQSSNTDMETEVVLDVKPQDQISVQAYSERGGVLKQVFTASEITQDNAASDASPQDSALTEKSPKTQKSY